MTEKKAERSVGSPANDPPQGSPHYPAELEQWLVVARAQQEKTFKQRAAQIREGDDLTPAGKSVSKGQPENRPEMARGELLRQRADQKQRVDDRGRMPLGDVANKKLHSGASRDSYNLQQVAESLAPAASKGVEPALLRRKPGHWVLSAGLVIAGLVVASFADVRAMSSGFTDMKNRVGTLLAFSARTPSDVALTAETTPKELNQPPVPSVENSITVPSASAPPSLARTLRSAVERPPESPAPSPDPAASRSAGG